MEQQLDKSKNRGQKQFSIADFGKIPPQAVDLEKGVLAVLTLEKDAYETISEFLTPECFYLESHQRIFKAINSLALRNMSIDLMTLTEELNKTEELDLVGGSYYLVKLQDNISSGSSLLTHAKIIYQKYHLRELIKIGSEIISMAYESSTDNFELQDHAEKILSDLGARNTGEMIHISKVVGQMINKIEEWRQIDGSITGVPSGFPDLDRATRGWQPGDLIFLAARSSVGKTAFALNLIKSAALNNIKPSTVAVWSLEMKALYLTLRMLAADSKTFLHKIQTGKLSDEEMSTIIWKSVKILASLDIFFNDNSHVTMSSIRHKARRLKKKNKLGLIVIDYVQLMKGESKGGNREREVAEISRELKELAQELDIPIIALSQLNRETGEKNVKWEYGPPTSSMRESGSLEQDADVVILLWGPSDEEIKQDPSLAGQRRVRIAKQRNGVLKTVTLNFKSEIQLFEKIEEVTGIPASFKPLSSLPPVKNYYENEPDEDAPF